MQAIVLQRKGDLLVDKKNVDLSTWIVPALMNPPERVDERDNTKR